MHLTTQTTIRSLLISALALGCTASVLSGTLMTLSLA